MPPALAQDTQLSGTLGVVALSLPSVPTGVSGTGDISVPSSAGGLALGVSFGADAVIELGAVGGSSAFVGASVFGIVAQGSSSVTSSLDGSGALVIPGYSTPSNFTISLDTTSGGGTAGANSNLSQGGEINNVNLPAGNGINYGWGVNPDDDLANDPGFLYGGIFTNGPANQAASFGAVADQDGNIFVAVGDLTGVNVTTSVTRTVAHLGGDVTLGLSGEPGAGMSISGFVGPSYMFLGQDIGTNISVDFPEAGTGLAGSVMFPTYTLSRNENLDSHYLGGVIGGSLSTPLSNNTVLNLNAKAGIYSVSTSFTGSERAIVSGGNPAPTPDPISVANLNTISLNDSGVGYSAQGGASLAVPLGDNKQVSFGGGAKYLSHVATISRPLAPTIDTSAYGSSDDDGAVTYNTQENLAPTLSFGDMWSFSGFVTLSGRF